MDGRELLVERLARLGFSQYEGRAYVGLLTHGEQTGYALANASGVPQPKIYETLRRLKERGAVFQTSERPARFVPVPAAALLEALEQDFVRRLREARDGLARLPKVSGEEPGGQTRRLAGWEPVLAHAVASLDRAEGKVYLSGRSTDLEPLGRAVLDAVGRGVTFVVMHFGPLPFAVPRGQAFRHASTEGSVYPSHRAHHLAVVADSKHVVWAVARDGATWRGMAGQDDLLASVVKGYVRHDIMIQRIFADLPDQLTDLYGPGLLDLANIASARGGAPAGQQEIAV